MKTSLFVSALLIAAFTSQAHCAVTEKLAANAEKIAHIKKDIAQGKSFDAKAKCDSRGGCSVKA